MAGNGAGGFVGGAERARRNARKRRFQPRPDNNPNPNRNEKRQQRRQATTISPYPKSMREHERYFGALLSSSVASIVQSESDGASYRRVMNQACSLLNVPAVPTPSHLLPCFTASSSAEKYHENGSQAHQLRQRSTSSLILSNAPYCSSIVSSSRGTYENARAYYMSKAPLILEESRCIIAQELLSRSNSRSYYELELDSTDEKYPKLFNKNLAPLIMHFNIKAEPQLHRNNERSTKFSRPGSVLLLQQQQDSANSGSALACIAPNGNWEAASNTVLTLMIFRRQDFDLSSLSEATANNSSEVKLSFQAIPITALISQVRQMEACLRMVKVSFMPKLLGQKSSTHIRFDASSEEESEEEMENSTDCNTVHQIQEGWYVDEEEDSSYIIKDGEQNDMDNTLTGLLDKLSPLNPTQERAAKTFLDSCTGSESLTLVQGPPGSGKTTFLVHVICRRLATNPMARLMITAPTNKAVTVLAERFLDVVNSGTEELSSKCNAVLIGVEDKLVKNEGEYISSEALSSSLRRIFVYTWIDSLKNQYLSVLTDLNALNDAKLQTIESCEKMISLMTCSERLSTKLSLSLPSARSACTSASLLVQELEAAALASESMTVLELEEAIRHCKELTDALGEIHSPTQELLATARVIFCTLSTAGSSVLKQTRSIDDLLIDECAAATEPEICIPFHLRPGRCLAVGDPLQLPPTIMSRHAADMGLSESMHERLMNQAGKEFVMLDQQYRMIPEISYFPCKQFYGGKVANGENVRCKSYTSNIELPIKSPYSFINICGEEYRASGGSYANKEECMAVVNLTEKLASRGEALDWHSPDKLRIITFYQGQVTQLRRLLAKRGLGRALVATVDSSQGCEADIVIISFVRSSSKKGARYATGFLADDRRINVALTRARHQLVCVGNASTLLEGSVSLKNLITDANQRGCLL